MSAGKLVLGTVQFGCSYGINSAGRPSSDSVREILSTASSSGISLLDTSSAYGDAETVLGSCRAAGMGFRIVSKYPKGSGPVDRVCRESLERLGAGSLYGYMLHHFELYRNDPSIWDSFRRLREEGSASKVGFSLYSPAELELLLDRDVDFDILQFPRNIFDRQFDPYLPELKRRGVEIHVRSTFLQGLFFKDRNSLPPKLAPIRKYLEELDRISAESGVSISSLALGFNCGCKEVDGVLIGVDNESQLLENLASVSEDVPVIDIDVREKELLNPVNWN